MASKTLRQAVAILGGQLRLEKTALLLPIQSQVMARHLLPLAEIAKAQGIQVFFTATPKLLRRKTEIRRVRAYFAGKADYIRSLKAHLYRWTLVVMADHAYFHTLAYNGSPLVHVGHGNPSKSSRATPGLPWEYSHIPRFACGTAMYREMIESAIGVKQAVIDIDPALGEKITVLGRPLDDTIIQARAAYLREQRASAPATLLLVSTLGADSAFARYWHEIVAAATALEDQYSVVLCPHPNEYDHWKKQATGSSIAIMPPDVSTEDLLAEASVVISDFSSICQKAAMLGIPLIFFRQDDAPVWPQGATARLYALSPKWQPGIAMQSPIEQAMEYSDAAQQVSRVWVNSYPGRGEAAFTDWLQCYFKKQNSQQPAR